MSSTHSPRGSFIVFEGLDRSGKSTQVQNLLTKLEKQGTKARLQKFPDRTTAIGGMIDSYLRSQSELDDRAIHLLFSANRWECAASIERDLSSGITVIADRYAFSGAAFSAAKGLPLDYCLQPDTGLPLPDLVLYLTLSPETASSRAAYGSERYENVEMQTEVRKQFGLVADEVGRKHGEGVWREISAEGSIEEVEERIWTAVAGLRTRQKELGKLWTS